MVYSPELYQTDVPLLKMNSQHVPAPTDRRASALMRPLRTAVPDTPDGCTECGVRFSRLCLLCRYARIFFPNGIGFALSRIGDRLAVLICGSENPNQAGENLEYLAIFPVIAERVSFQARSRTVLHTVS